MVPPHKSGQGTLEQKARRSYPDCTVVPQHHSALVTIVPTGQPLKLTIVPYPIPCHVSLRLLSQPNLTSPHFTSPNARSVWVWLVLDVVNVNVLFPFNTPVFVQLTSRQRLDSALNRQPPVLVYFVARKLPNVAANRDPSRRLVSISVTPCLVLTCLALFGHALPTSLQTQPALNVTPLPPTTSPLSTTSPHLTSTTFTHTSHFPCTPDQVTLFTLADIFTTHHPIDSTQMALPGLS